MKIVLNYHPCFLESDKLVQKRDDRDFTLEAEITPDTSLRKILDAVHAISLKTLSGENIAATRELVDGEKYNVISGNVRRTLRRFKQGYPFNFTR